MTGDRVDQRWIITQALEPLIREESVVGTDVVRRILAVSAPATRCQTPPTNLSSDHDRRYQFQRWQANLRVLDVEAIKTVPYAPVSHPFVERLIGTIQGNAWIAPSSGRPPIWR